jgi:Voltage gated chloride channel
MYGFEDLFGHLPVHWMWWPAIGGVGIGIGGIFFPRGLGVGYGNIAELLQGNAPLKLLVGLIVAKPVMWAFSLGSGTSGGVLAPLLMIGGALGEMVAVLAHASVQARRRGYHLTREYGVGPTRDGKRDGGDVRTVRAERERKWPRARERLPEASLPETYPYADETCRGVAETMATAGVSAMPVVDRSTKAIGS